ncbi:hypothetical protein DERP_007249 [Dermatophagoides pteronyssinus]|uniref:Uncharacterized protein n=1 Tax=Dermatophagoides pteronyssinus TaxID=6956 RepID=A0ABQ8J441_DERPT|nr:hypothetical protein DERP_007249 [Dermatophagoides pteronyssinus]
MNDKKKERERLENCAIEDVVFDDDIIFDLYSPYKFGIRLAGKFAELILTILVIPEAPVGVIIKFFGKFITADLALALLLKMPKQIADEFDDGNVVDIVCEFGNEFPVEFRTEFCICNVVPRVVLIRGCNMTVCCRVDGFNLATITLNDPI